MWVILVLEIIGYLVYYGLVKSDLGPIDHPRGKPKDERPE